MPRLQNQQLHDHRGQILGGAAIAGPEGIRKRYPSSALYAMAMQTVLLKAMLDRWHRACLQAILALLRRQQVCGFNVLNVLG